MEMNSPWEYGLDQVSLHEEKRDKAGGSHQYCA
jgi:hypothetical protein